MRRYASYKSGTGSLKRTKPIKTRKKEKLVMTSVILDIMLGSLIWLGGGYLCGDFIIRWNKQHLTTYPFEREKLRIAYRLNADLHLRDGTKVSKWRVLLTLMGPVTIPKAVLLRVCGGPA